MLCDCVNVYVAYVCVHVHVYMCVGVIHEEV